MALNPKIPFLPSNAIATYAFTDVASGLGFNVFYGISSEDQSAVSYHLQDSTDVYSSQSTTARAAAGTTTMNFDTTTFNTPRVAKGTAYVSVGVGLNNTTCRIDAQISVIDAASSATTITSEISSQDFTIGATDAVGFAFIPLPLTETVIKEGEKLRITMKLVQTGTGNSEMGHDPKNQKGSYIGVGSNGGASTMILLMPFKLNL